MDIAGSTAAGLDRGPRSKTRGRLRRVLVALTSLVGIFAVNVAGGTNAWADDYFYLNNNTGVPISSYSGANVTLCGGSLNNGPQMDWTSTPTDFWHGMTGQMYLDLGSDANPWNLCGGNYLNNIGVGLGSLGRTAGFGAYQLQAWNPAVGSSGISCGEIGGIGYPINQFISCQVDGNTATLALLPGVAASALSWNLAYCGQNVCSSAGRAAVPNPKLAHVRFSANIARVRSGRAQIPVQVFSTGHAKVIEQVELRNWKTQKLLGYARVKVEQGHPVKASVPLPAVVTRALGAGRDLRVSAMVRHVDGTRGSWHKVGVITLTGRALPNPVPPRPATR